jgi:hypothetical protein
MLLIQSLAGQPKAFSVVRVKVKWDLILPYKCPWSVNAIGSGINEPLVVSSCIWNISKKSTVYAIQPRSLEYFQNILQKYRE